MHILLLQELDIQVFQIINISIYTYEAYAINPL